MKETVRQEQILEAAVRRFARFGIAKTTMTEIAEDLGLTKQAVHYYYADKNVLAQAATRQVAAEYLVSIEIALAGAGTIATLLERVIEVRACFFHRYYPLLSELEMSGHESARECLPLLQEVRVQEAALLAARLSSAIAGGELRALDAASTATLLLETLSALGRQLHLKRLPGDDEFAGLLARQRALVHLFYEGLRNPIWNN